MENVVIVCQSCNVAKGNLMRDEFEGLLRFLDTLPGTVARGVLTRLKIGGAFKSFH
jgi:5-methylcytosine-specific restriction endonuclease McrA